MKTDVKKDLNYYLSLAFTIILREDEEGDWIARVDELPGCAAHGASPSDALKELEEVKKAWVEDALETGDPIPEPAADEGLPSGKWVQRVPRSLHKKLAQLAKKEAVSLNQFVTATLAEAVGRKSQIAKASKDHEFDAWQTGGTFVVGHHPGVKWQIHQPVAHRRIRFAEALDFAGSQIEHDTIN